MSRLTDLVSKVLNRSESRERASSSTPTSRAPESSTESTNRKNGENGQTSTSSWLSHFAEVAPDHIKRWTNANDGSGNISYEQLVQNLKHFKIPARHAAEFDVAEVFEVVAPKQLGLQPPQAPEQKSSGSGENSMQTYTEVVPVCSVTRSFVGPVANTVGMISGVSCKSLKRPGPNSTVPEDYVEVIGSKKVEPLASIPCTANRQTSRSSSVCALKEAKGAALQKQTNFHKPPPIYLKPRILASRQSSISNGDRAEEEFLSRVQLCTPASISPEAINTREAQEIFEASKKPVVYTMGQYIWSEAEAKFGSAAPTEPPPIDKYFGKLCEELFFKKAEKTASEKSSEKEGTTSSEDGPRAEGSLFVQEVLDVSKARKEQLAKLGSEAVEVRGESGPAGVAACLFSTKALKRGEVAFVETPLLTGDWDHRDMWKVFVGLDEKTSAKIALLPGSSDDLSEEESLLCLLQARAGNRLSDAKAFKLFYAKVKRHAHSHPSTAAWSLYSKAALLPHSCAPNLTFRNENGILVFVAACDIAQGDRLSMTHVDQLYAPRAYRQKRLAILGIETCRCVRCASGVDKERRMLCPSCRPTKLKILAHPPKQDAVQTPEGKEKVAATAKVDRSVKEVDESSTDAAFSGISFASSFENSDGGNDADSKESLSSGDESENALWSGDASEISSSAGRRSPIDASEVDASEEDGECSQKKVERKCGLKLSIRALKTAASFTTCATSEDDVTMLAVSSSDEETCLSPSTSSLQLPRNYCQRNESGEWLCSTCGSSFSDEDLPLGMEEYFERLYEGLQSRFAFPTPADWSVETASLIRSIQVVLGTEHWLYAATNLLLSLLYLGQGGGGIIRDCLFDRALQHAEVFMRFIEETTPETTHVDLAPLVASLMRVLLFNGRWKTFQEWVVGKRLAAVGFAFGRWSEEFLSFERAAQYIDICQIEKQLPQLAMLHRLAHSSQHSIVQRAATLEELARKKREEEEERTRQLEETRRQEQARLKQLQERNKKVRERVDRLKKETEIFKAQRVARNDRDATASNLSGSDLPSTPQFMLSGVHPLVLNNAAKSVEEAYASACRMQEASVNGRPVCPSFLSPNSVYLPPEGVMPCQYLPLIMLDDPLRAIPEKSREARRRKIKSLREREIAQRGVATQDLDFEEDESENEETEASAEQKESAADATSDFGEERATMVYRIPGLSGSAPGEFVNVSQFVHDKEGRHPPLPFFNSFFYIDTEERRKGHANGEKSDGEGGVMVLSSCQTPPDLPAETLADLSNAKHNYLHEERKKFEQEVRDGVFLLASEMQFTRDEKTDAANANSTSPFDSVEASNKVIQSIVLSEVKAERALLEARLEMKGLASSSDNSEKDINNADSQRPTKMKAEEEDVPQNVCALNQKESDKESRTSKARDVWVETLPSPGSEGGPTVFFYESKNQLVESASPAGQEVSPLASHSEEASMSACVAPRRFLKPLDFSAIPPPPIPASLIRGPIGGHRHYKLTQMQSIASRLPKAPQL